MPVSNYRPISLLCIIPIVLDKVIFIKISEVVYSVISVNQYQFIPGRGSVHKRLTFLSTVIEALDHNVTTDVVYLDTSKAFDSVSHHHLLHRLLLLASLEKSFTGLKITPWVVIIMSPWQGTHLNIFQLNLLLCKEVFWVLSCS